MKRILFLLWMTTQAVVTIQAYDFETGGVYYDRTSQATVSVTAGDQPYEGYFTLPDEVAYGGDTYQVTGIADNAFRECSSLVGVVLPKGLKTIGDSAFFCCRMLAAMQLPEGLESIGKAAFYGCSTMYSVNVPSTVTTIGSEAFLRCTRLSAIQVDSRNNHYCAVDGVLMDEQQTQLIAYPNEHGEHYDVPANVKEIAASAFLGCSKLESITLPDGLMTIGDAAFYGCTMLQSVTVPNSVEHIGLWAFSECDQLKTAVLGNGVSEVGEGAFSFCPMLKYIRVRAANAYYCTVDDVLLTKDVRTLLAFPGAKTGSYRIPSTVETIGSQAFFGCHHVESVTLPAGLSSLGDNPFVFCDGLKEILVSSEHPDLVSNDGVLMNKQQTELVFYPNAKEGAYTIPNGVTALYNGPFMGSRLLTGLTVPNSVTSIGNWTFMGCDGLLSVSLPPTLQRIGERAFLDCTSLRTLICSAEPQTTDAFTPENFINTTLYVPHGMESSYLETDGWNAFENVSTFGLFADDQNIKRGRWYRLPVCSSGPLHLTSLQLDITLPDGLEIATNDDGSCVIELAEGVTGTLTCQPKGSRRYRVTMSTDDRRGLKTEGNILFYMSLRASSETGLGVRDLLLQDVSIAFASDVHEGEAHQPDVAMGLNLEMFLGDVNRNGRLNVADVTETFRYLRADPTPTFHFSEADVNQNGKVNIVDVMETIELLHKEAPAAALEWFWDGNVATADCLQPADITIEQDARSRLVVGLRNTIQDYTSHQFQLLLPAGVTLAADAEGHYLCEPSARYEDAEQTVYVSEIGRNDDGSMLYNVVCASPSVLPISYHEGDLLTLTLQADKDAMLGMASGLLRRIVFADVNASEYAFDDAPFQIRVAENTGISEIEIIRNAGNEKYYNLNGQRVSTPTKGVYVVSGRKVLMR